MRICLTALFLFTSLLAYSQCTNSSMSIQVSWENSCDMNFTDTIPHVQLIVSNGVPPIHIYDSFYIDTIINTANDTFNFLIPDFSSGNFEVTDFTGCYLYGETSLYDQFSPFRIVSTPPTCQSCCDGMAYRIITRPISPTTGIVWSDGQNGFFADSLCADSLYSLSTIDSITLCISSNYFYFSSANIINCTDTISGNIFIDLNSNGVKDINESDADNITVAVNPVNGVAQTDQVGNYSMRLPSGIYQVYPALPQGWNVSSTPSVQSVNLNGSAANINFGIYHPGSGSIELNAFNDWPRCFNNIRHYINITNSSMVTFDSISVQYNYSPNLIFTSSNLPASIGVNTLSWTTQSLSPLNSTQVYAYFDMPGVGNTNYNVNATAWSNNSIVASATYTYSQTIGCSFDPNDISVLPAGSGSNYLTPMGSRLDYLIRFQNTGNDTAYDISIKNPIDTSMDLSSLQLISSSHPVRMSYTGTTMTFSFDQIMLPDSNHNEPESHGYIRYSLLPKSNRFDPTVVYNSALIFFDRNAPVVTNIVMNTLSNLLSVNFIPDKEPLPQVYPNPVSENFNIRFDKNNGSITMVEIVDVFGRIIETKRHTVESVLTISTHKYTNGLYYIRFIDKNRLLIGSTPLVKQ